MESSSSKMIDYLSNLPKNQDIDAISLTSKYAIQNVVQCVFSIDAKCFETEDSDFHTNIRDIFAPTFLVAQAIPKWLVNILPISLVPILLALKFILSNNISFVFWLKSAVI